MRLNLGCGSRVPDGWTNVDYALGARLQKLPFFRVLNRKHRLVSMDWSEKIELHDLTKAFPWADCSVDVVYSSHTLEHLSKEQGRQFLAECQRVLRKGGLIRIAVPDLKQFVAKYLEGRMRSDDFIDNLGVLYSPKNGAIRQALASIIEFPHKCMYDERTLLEILTEIGFDASRRAAFDSEIPGIRDVETAERTGDHTVIVEGRKW